MSNGNRLRLITAQVNEVKNSRGLQEGKTTGGFLLIEGLAPPSRVSGRYLRCASGRADLKGKFYATHPFRRMRGERIRFPLDLVIPCALRIPDSRFQIQDGSPGIR